MDKQKMKKIDNEKNERFITAELETRMLDDSDEKLVEGYASLFDQRYDIAGWFDEVVERGAFDETDMSDVVLNFNHNNDVILGRTTAGTLTLTVDERGLKFKANLPDTQQANDLYKSIKRGDINQCSFAFIVDEANWVEESEKELRKITKIKKLYDVSITTFGANPKTSVDARNQDVEKEKRQALLRKLKRNKLIKKLKEDSHGISR